MSNEQQERTLVVRHPVGPIAIDLRRRGDGLRLRRLRLLPLGTPLPPKPPDLPPWLQRLCDELADGRTPVWALQHCETDGLTPFRREVLTCLGHTVGEGQVVSYRQLAERSGAPGATRAVGGALAANPFPLILPCHRVVAADGRLGGFMGDQADRSGWKRRLLEREGIRLHRGRVTAPAGNRPG